jgi:phenylalanyl-tRNA synthetase beta subunit
MNFVQQAAMSLGVGILKMALPMITSGLRDMMIEGVKKWKAYAETTPYNFDNLVCKALETLLGLDVPEEAVTPLLDRLNNQVGP